VSLDKVLPQQSNVELELRESDEGRALPITQQRLRLVKTKAAVRPSLSAHATVFGLGIRLAPDAFQNLWYCVQSIFTAQRGH